METKTTRKRHNRPAAFKREAVRQLEARGERTVADVAAGRGGAENLLHFWKKTSGAAFAANSFWGPRFTTAELAVPAPVLQATP